MRDRKDWDLRRRMSASYEGQRRTAVISRVNFEREQIYVPQVWGQDLWMGDFFSRCTWQALPSALPPSPQRYLTADASALL